MKRRQFDKFCQILSWRQSSGLQPVMYLGVPGVGCPHGHPYTYCVWYQPPAFCIQALFVMQTYVIKSQLRSLRSSLLVARVADPVLNPLRITLFSVPEGPRGEFVLGVPKVL